MLLSAAAGMLLSAAAGMLLSAAAGCASVPEALGAGPPDSTMKSLSSHNIRLMRLNPVGNVMAFCNVPWLRITIGCVSDLGSARKTLIICLAMDHVSCGSAATDVGKASRLSSVYGERRHSGLHIASDTQWPSWRRTVIPSLSSVCSGQLGKCLLRRQPKVTGAVVVPATIQSDMNLEEMSMSTTYSQKRGVICGSVRDCMMAMITGTRKK